VASAIFAIPMALSIMEAVFLALMTIISRRYRLPPQSRGACGKPAVIMACRDEPPELLLRTLESLNDSLVNRVVIVDDSDPSHYAAIAEKLRPLKNVMLVHRADNRGFKPGALNDALRVVDEDLVVVADADTLLGDFVERACSLVPSRLDAVQASTTPARVDDAVSACYATITLFRNSVLAPACSAMGLVFLSGYGFAVARRLLVGVGGWSEDSLAEDLDLSLRLSVNKCRYAFLPDVYVTDEPPATFSSLVMQQRRWMRGAIQVFFKSLALGLKGEGRALLYAPIAGLFMGLLANVAAVVSAFLSPFIGPPAAPVFIASGVIIDASLAVTSLSLFLHGRGRFGAARTVEGLLLSAVLYNLLSICLPLDALGVVAGRRFEWSRTEKRRVNSRSANATMYLAAAAIYSGALLSAIAKARLLAPWMASLLASVLICAGLELKLG